MELLSKAKLDGRSLERGTAEATLRDCLQRLQNADGSANYDALADWLLHELMSHAAVAAAHWDIDDVAQRLIGEFEGSPIDLLYLKGVYQMYVLESAAEAFSNFEAGVNLGDPNGRCHCALGMCFETRLIDGTRVNLTRAVALYRESVDLSNACALYRLGRCYCYGRGVELDQEEAARLYTLAHLQGYPAATDRLADMYAGDRGVAGVVQNGAVSLALRIEAAARGEDWSLQELKRLRKRDPTLVIPFSCWRPLCHVHKWVTDSLDMEIVSLYIARSRPDGFINSLPRGIVLQISGYLCCRPRLLRVHVAISAEI